MRSGYPEPKLDPDKIPGLSRLATRTVKKLIKHGRLVRLPAGWTLIRADEPADEAYLIIEGCVEVVDGDETVADVCSGEFIGEMGLVERKVRSARVTVTTPVRALTWPRDDFQSLRRHHPDFDELVTETANQRFNRNKQRATS